MAGTHPILDEAQLARQTAGDGALAREVLGLFAAQLAALGPRLERAGEGERGELLHGLKGSARAVGAAALADLLAVMEEDCGAADRGSEFREVLDATLRALTHRAG